MVEWCKAPVVGVNVSGVAKIRPSHEEHESRVMLDVSHQLGFSSRVIDPNGFTRTSPRGPFLVMRNRIRALTLV